MRALRIKRYGKSCRVWVDGEELHDVVDLTLDMSVDDMPRVTMTRLISEDVDVEVSVIDDRRAGPS